MNKMNSNIEVFDTNYLQDTYEINDPDILFSLYSEYLDQLENMKSEISNINNNSDESVKELYKFIYHKNKSSALGVGANKLGYLLKNLESEIKNISIKEILAYNGEINDVATQTKTKILEYCINLIKET